MKVTTLGIDIAKSVFVLHGVSDRGRTVLQKSVTRAKLLETVAKLSPCTIGMEACGGAHHWAREFEKMGHTVKLMHAKYVKPYVKAHKNDGRDAEAVCEATGRPNMRFVPVKTVAQQELVRPVVHAGSPGEAADGPGEPHPGALDGTGPCVPPEPPKSAFGTRPASGPENSSLSPFAKELFGTLKDQFQEIEGRIALFDDRIRRVHRTHPMCQRLSRIPGIGPVTAVALVATLPGITFFENSRHLSAWLGLVPPAGFERRQDPVGTHLKTG